MLLVSGGGYFLLKMGNFVCANLQTFKLLLRSLAISRKDLLDLPMLGGWKKNLPNGGLFHGDESHGRSNPSSITPKNNDKIDKDIHQQKQVQTQDLHLFFAEQKMNRKDSEHNPSTTTGDLHPILFPPWFSGKWSVKRKMGGLSPMGAIFHF